MALVGLTPKQLATIHAGLIEELPVVLPVVLPAIMPNIVTPTSLGLENVNNISDVNKPVSSAQQTALNLKQSLSEKAQANGYASLDSAGKIPITQLPSAIMEYKGVWNATNTPTLSDVTGNNGNVYRVNVAGTVDFGSGNIIFDIGDYAIHNGNVWEKSDTTDAVVSVAGKTGVITLVKADVGLGNVDNTSDVDKPISTLQQAAIDNLKLHKVKTTEQTLTNTALANDIELQVTLQAGRTYAFKLVYFTTAGNTPTDGLKIDFGGGSATVTTFVAHSTYQTADGLNIALTNPRANTRTTLISAPTTGVTTGIWITEGTILVNAGGTFIPRAAKVADVGTDPVLNQYSKLIIDDITP